MFLLSVGKMKFSLSYVAFNFHKRRVYGTSEHVIPCVHGAWYIFILIDKKRNEIFGDRFWIIFI